MFSVNIEPPPILVLTMKYSKPPWVLTKSCAPPALKAGALCWVTQRAPGSGVALRDIPVCAESHPVGLPAWRVWSTEVWQVQPSFWTLTARAASHVSFLHHVTETTNYTELPPITL